MVSSRCADAGRYPGRHATGGHGVTHSPTPFALHAAQIIHRYPRPGSSWQGFAAHFHKSIAPPRQRRPTAGKGHWLVIITPHPHYADVLVIETGKPGIALIITGTGFGRQR